MALGMQFGKMTVGGKVGMGEGERSRRCLQDPNSRPSALTHAGVMSARLEILVLVRHSCQSGVLRGKQNDFSWKCFAERPMTSVGNASRRGKMASNRGASRRIKILVGLASQRKENSFKSVQRAVDRRRTSVWRASWVSCISRTWTVAVLQLHRHRR